MRMFGTMALGLLGGALFLWASIPLPWLLGSFAIIALVSVTRMASLSIPASWRGYAMSGIGMALGSGFSPETLAHIPEWRWSLAVMIALSVAFCLLAFLILRKWSDMDRMTAFLASVPGSVSLVSSLAEDYGAESRRIALSHSARLIALLTMTPIMLHTLTDIDLVEASKKALFTMPTFDLVQTPLVVVTAVLSYLVGKRSGIPAGTLMVPLFVSAALHLFGVVTTPLPGFVAIISQAVIGTGIGLRFAGYRLRDILRDGWLSTLIGIGLSAAAFAAALGVAKLTGLPVVPLLLAFLPGGAPELGAVAIALHADPAMVAGHHFVRLVIIIGAVPLVALRLMGRSRRTTTEEPELIVKSKG